MMQLPAVRETQSRGNRLVGSSSKWKLMVVKRHRTCFIVNRLVPVRLLPKDITRKAFLVDLSTWMRLLALLSLVQTVFCFSSAPYRRKTGTHFERLSIFSANRNRSFRYRQSRLLVPISAPPSSKSDETPQSLTSFRSRIKAMVPPSHERRKIVPLCIMFFLIISNYTILRSTKDVLVSG